MTMYTIFKRFLVSVAVFLCLVSSSQASSTATKDGGKKTSLTPEVKSRLAIVALKKLQQEELDKNVKTILSWRTNFDKKNNTKGWDYRFFSSNSKGQPAANLEEFQAYLRTLLKAGQIDLNPIFIGEWPDDPSNRKSKIMQVNFSFKTKRAQTQNSSLPVIGFDTFPGNRIRTGTWIRIIYTYDPQKVVPQDATQTPIAVKDAWPERAEEVTGILSLPQ